MEMWNDFLAWTNSHGGLISLLGLVVSGLAALFASQAKTKLDRERRHIEIRGLMSERRQKFTDARDKLSELADQEKRNQQRPVVYRELVPVLRRMNHPNLSSLNSATKQLLTSIKRFRRSNFWRPVGDRQLDAKAARIFEDLAELISEIEQLEASQRIGVRNGR